MLGLRWWTAAMMTQYSTFLAHSRLALRQGYKPKPLLMQPMSAWAMLEHLLLMRPGVRSNRN